MTLRKRKDLIAEILCILYKTKFMTVQRDGHQLLDWLPIDDIICIRKLYMLHKINQGHCPAYFNKYIEHISNTHNHNTRRSEEHTSELQSPT